MDTTLLAYQDLVDSLVARSPCVLANRVAHGAIWMAESDLAEFNELVTSLTISQRVALSRPALMASSRILFNC